MKKVALIFATVMAVALLMTGCFGAPAPAPTATATTAPTSTIAPTSTDLPTSSVLPDATNMLEATAEPTGLNVAPSPSASANP